MGGIEPSRDADNAIRSRLEPIKRVARTLKAHTSGLINYFTHRITNAVTEGLNSKIQDLKSAARGFRNFHRYRIRILYLLRQTPTPSDPLRLKQIPRKSPKKPETGIH